MPRRPGFSIEYGFHINIYSPGHRSRLSLSRRERVRAEPGSGQLGRSSVVADVTFIEADLNAPQHQQAIVDLLNAYARDPMGGGHELPPEVSARLIPGLQQHPTTLVFLALEGEKPVGIAVCFRGFSTFAARPLLNVHDLAVLPEYRGQGVGRLLLEQVEARGRELGCFKLTLEVRADNLRAQRLYQQYGFGDIPLERGTIRHWFLQKTL